MRVFKSFLTFSLITLVSRIFGFIRDILLASIIPTGILSDTFYSSFRFISIIKSLFADGPMSAAFVPNYMQKEEKMAKIFVAQILTALILLIATVCIFLYIFTPLIIARIAPGFIDDAQQFHLIIFNFRLMLPYCFFITIAAFFGCILQAKNKVYGTASLPIIINLVFIAAALISRMQNLDSLAIIKLMSCAVSVAGVCQVLLLLIMIYINKIYIGFSNNFINLDVWNAAKKLASTMISGCLNRTNILINIYFASQIVGMTSYINYADRIVNLPISLIGVAMNVSILPELSKIIKNKDLQQSYFLQNRIIELSLIFCIPIATLIFLFNYEITYSLFYRGKFNLADVQETAYMLRIFSLAIPTMILSQILITNFFARQDTRTPLIITFITIVTNIFGNIYLRKMFDYEAIVYSYIASIWMNFLLIFSIACYKKFLKIDLKFARRISKMFLAIFIMISSIIFLTHNVYFDISTLSSAKKLTLLITISLIVYAISIFILRVYKINDNINYDQYIKENN